MPVTTSFKSNKLLLAAKTFDWQEVESLIDQHKDDLDINVMCDRKSDPTYGMTPIVYAAADHQWKLVDKILTSFPEVKVNVQAVRTHLSEGDDSKNLYKTPIYFAIMAKEWYIVEELLKRNAVIYYHIDFPKHWKEDCLGYLNTVRNNPETIPAEFEMGPLDDDHTISMQIMLNRQRSIFKPVDFHQRTAYKEEPNQAQPSSIMRL